MLSNFKIASHFTVLKKLMSGSEWVGLF